MTRPLWANNDQGSQQLKQLCGIKFPTGWGWVGGGGSLEAGGSGVVVHAPRQRRVAVPKEPSAACLSSLPPAADVGYSVRYSGETLGQ